MRARSGYRRAPAVVRAESDHGDAELVGDPDRPQAWTLFVDGTAQSHVDLDDPTHLEFEYVRRLAHLVDVLDPPGPAPLRVLHLGGGAWTLARYVAATRPGSTQQVVELDAALVDLVAARIPADGTGIDVLVDDARHGLERVPASSVDLVVLDAFAGSPDPGPPDVGGLRAGRREGAGARRGLRREPRRRRTVPVRPRPGGDGRERVR